METDFWSLAAIKYLKTRQSAAFWCSFRSSRRSPEMRTIARVQKVTITTTTIHTLSNVVRLTPEYSSGDISNALPYLRRDYVCASVGIFSIPLAAARWTTFEENEGGMLVSLPGLLPPGTPGLVPNQHIWFAEHFQDIIEKHSKPVRHSCIETSQCLLTFIGICYVSQIIFSSCPSHHRNCPK